MNNNIMLLSLRDAYKPSPSRMHGIKPSPSRGGVLQTAIGWGWGIRVQKLCKCACTTHPGFNCRLQHSLEEEGKKRIPAFLYTGLCFIKHSFSIYALALIPDIVFTKYFLFFFPLACGMVFDLYSSEETSC
jgi:hypothetical protein